MRCQASADKANKNLVDNLNAINKKVDAANLTLGDFGASKNKIANENGELLRVVGDLENNLNMLAKAKSALAAQLNDIKLMFKISVLSKKKLSLSGLIVAEGLDVIELSSKGRLGLGKHVQVVLKISNNTEELSIFIGNLVLGGSKVSKGKVGSINLLVDGVKVVNQVLVGLVSRSLASDNLISGSSGIRDFSHDGLLVLV